MNEQLRSCVGLGEAVSWICREAIAPRVWRGTELGEAGGLWMESNGSEGCYGGWELRFGVTARAGDEFCFELQADAADVARGVDGLVVEAFWYTVGGVQVDWDPVPIGGSRGSSPWSSAVAGSVPDAAQPTIGYAARLHRPHGAAELRVRCGLRWSPTGRVRWYGWKLWPVPPAPARLLRLGVASQKPAHWVSQEANAAHYLELCCRAGEEGVELVCLPELMLTVGMPCKDAGDVVAAAQSVPGRWLEPFQELARQYRMGICFSVYERAGAHGEIVYNTSVLLDRGGELIGTYRKVHLALAEARRGVAAGHEFPVFSFDGIIVGMLICMDSSSLESVRILAGKGAEVMLMPIAGDFRALSWARRGEQGNQFDEDRWRLIQRAHALDNHLFTAVARNNTLGSNVTAPWGEILAYDDGTKGVIWADTDVDDRRRHHTGSTMQAVLWSMRRPVTYGPLVETASAGPQGGVAQL